MKSKRPTATIPIFMNHSLTTEAMTGEKNTISKINNPALS